MKISLRLLHATATCLLMAGSLWAGESIPFESPLTTQEDLDRWTALDIDGNVEGEQATWYLGQTDYGGSVATSFTDAWTHKPTDNRLVSPALELTAGQQYVIKFGYYTAYYEDENLAIYLSRTPTIDEDATPVQELTLHNYYGGTQSVFLPEITETGDYYITLRHTADGIDGMVIGIKNFTVDTLKDGAAEGKVTTYINGATIPVEGVKVTFTGPEAYTAVTDAEGMYRFETIPAADYMVTYQKFGYEEDSYPRTVTVNASETLTWNISIYEMKKQALKGHVTDHAGNPLPGARISLAGYAEYAGATDAQGDFTISGIYLNNGYYGTSDYEMTIAKNGFNPVVKNQPLKYSYYDDHIKADDVALTYKGVAPAKANAAENTDGSIAIIWERPADITSFVFDNGEPGEPMGYDSGREENILGTIYRTPMDVKRVSWYRVSSEYAAAPPTEVILYIISLDDDGNPDPDNFLYAKTGIKSPVDAWTTFELPEAVSAPKGCLIALSAIGYLSLARDNSTEAAPAGTQLYSNTYVGGYRFFEDNGWTGAWMLRADGEIIEQGDFTPDVTFDVFRYEEASADNQASWEKIGDKLAALAHTDNDFANQPRGSYHYAIEATYGGGVVAEKVISNVVHKDQFTSVSVAVTADSDPADAEGATIKLDDGTHTYTAAVADGTASFDRVWKATYNVTVNHAGFELDDTTFDLSDAPAYTQAVTLKQIKRPVTNIDIIETADGRTLAWELYADIFDDFEGPGHNDFEINPAGEAGWQYIDNDGFPTYGFGMTTFPGMRSPMAAILLNGNNTEPALGINPAYSGERCLAFFAAYPTETGGGMQLNQSDDYMISPRLDFHKDFKFSFRAKTYEAQDGRLETIRVGYSTTTPDIDAFTWVTKGYIQVSDYNHDLFEYDIPAQARYVAINNHSDDVFMLAVDDVSLSSGIKHSGEPASVGAFKGYNVYVDGQLMQTLTETTWAIPQLPAGTHTAEVSKLYNGGESARLAIEFSSQSGIDAAHASGVKITLLHGNQLVISGDYHTATIWSSDGHVVAQGITGNGITSLDHLPHGVYIVKATCATGSVTKKLAL